MSSNFQATHVPSNSFVINISESHRYFPKIVQSILSQIVKQKNLDKLQDYGGVEGLASGLKTNLSQGINGDFRDMSQRKEAFGSNTYHQRLPAKKLFYFVWEALREPTYLILLVCAALLLGFEIKQHGLKEGWYDGGSIFVAVFFAIAISAIRQFKQNRLLLVRLSKARYNNIHVDVVRNGMRQKISVFEIVVGDVVCLKSGDQVPADGLLTDSRNSLVVDESSMNGESDPVEVDLSRNPFLFCGTKVTAGNGRMLVTSVGMNTTWGEMMSSIDSNEQTPLKFRLNKLTSSIGKVGLSVTFLVYVVLKFLYFIGYIKDKNGNTEYNGSKPKADDILNIVVGIIAAAVTILIDAISGGLPVAVTLTTYLMKRRTSDHAMDGELSACRTMGIATTICTDKTGTLTLNQMKVTKFWIGQESIEDSRTSSVATTVVELLNQGIGLNTTGSVHKSASGSEFQFFGSPTERAIQSWAVSELNLDMEGLKQSCEILHIEAFNSTKKKSGVLMRKREQNMMNVHMKGAAEMVLMCSHYYNVSGSIKVLDDVERKKFEGVIQGMAEGSLRCIAFAHKQVIEKENEEGKTQIEENCLTLLGLVGLMDPCRSGVKEAVEECQQTGVNVKMITGDNLFTAIGIATECGILKPNQDRESGVVVQGEEFRNYTAEERMEKVGNIRVIARSSPLDKLLMIQSLKQKGHVVAVIGNGTNDALALKEADIGILIGRQATDVAKACSDIIIMDDNFGSMAAVLRWGRCVYTNVQKFIQLQLTVNVVALIINSVASVSTGEVPLSAIQWVWVNLVMNTLGALAIATEKPTEELMEKPPVGRTKQLITNVMWRNILSQAFYQIAVLLMLQFKGEAIFNVSAKVNDTLILNVLVLCQVFNVFALWKLEKKNVFEGIHKSKLFLVIIGVAIALQVVIVEFLKKFADTERLNWWQWGVCVGFASASWLIGWVVEWIPIPEKPFLLWVGAAPSLRCRRS